MNNKLRKFVREEGFCCVWAYLEANRATYTSILMKDIGSRVTTRALQQNRASYRSKTLVCEKLEKCLKEKIKAGHPLEQTHGKI